MRPDKSDLINEVRARARCSKADARQWVETILESVIHVTIEKGCVSVYPLGSMSVTYSAGKPHSLSLCPSTAVVEQIRAMGSPPSV